EEGAVAAAELLHGGKVARVRNADAAFGLQGLHDEGGEPARRQMPLQRVEIAERDDLGAGQHGAEALAPERIAHQRERATSQSVERAMGVKQSIATGVSARKLDCRLHALAAGIGEIDALESAAGELHQRSE